MKRVARGAVGGGAWLAVTWKAVSSSQLLVLSGSLLPGRQGLSTFSLPCSSASCLCLGGR